MKYYQLFRYFQFRSLEKGKKSIQKYFKSVNCRYCELVKCFAVQILFSFFCYSFALDITVITPPPLSFITFQKSIISQKYQRKGVFSSVWFVLNYNKKIQQQHCGFVPISGAYFSNWQLCFILSIIIGCNLIHDVWGGAVIT